MQTRSLLPVGTQLGWNGNGYEQQANGQPFSSSVRGHQVVRYDSSPVTFNNEQTFASEDTVSEQATAIVGWAHAPMRVVQGSDVWVGAIPDSDGFFSPRPEPVAAQAPRRGQQPYSVYDTHVHRRADPGPRFNISATYGFRSLFQNPSTQLIQYVERFKSDGLVSIGERAANREPPFRNADGAPWQAVRWCASQGSLVKIEGIGCCIGNIITYERDHPDRPGGKLILHGIVVQALEACTVDVVRIVSGEFLKASHSNGLIALRFGAGLQLSNIDNSRFYRTDKRDLVKLDCNISVLSEDLVNRRMILDGPPFMVFWENDKTIRFDLMTG